MGKPGSNRKIFLIRLSKLRVASDDPGLRNLLRDPGEAFGTWVDRVGPKEIGAGLSEYDEKRSREDAPEDFQDWGESKPFQVILGTSECAG
jgi:hypothetical protein